MTDLEFKTKLEELFETPGVPKRFIKLVDKHNQIDRETLQKIIWTVASISKHHNI